MAHAFLQQHLEILPLYGAGVLKLVDHDVVELRTDFLEDEWRVGVGDELAEQRLRFAEHKAILGAVELVEAGGDAVEQAQLVHVAQREHCRLVEVGLAGAFLLGIFEQLPDDIGNSPIGGRCVVAVGSLDPGRRIVDGFGDAFADNLLVVELAVAQLDEIACWSAGAVRKVVHSNLVSVESVEERVGIFLHRVDSFVADGAQHLRVLLEEVLTMQHLVDLVSVGAIDVLEDVVAELLNLADDIPRFVVIDGLVDVVENPCQLLAIVVQTVDEVVDGLLFHLLVVEGDAQVCGKVELACQIA